MALAKQLKKWGADESTEIKMIVLTILNLSYPTLEGGKYTVVDPLNITSVQPSGKLFLSPLDRPLI